MTDKLWGGRFSKKTDPLVEEFTKSIQFDYKIAKADLLGSMLHVLFLKKCGFLSGPEAEKLFSELKSIHTDMKSESLKDTACEDVHTYIQNKLQEKVGDLALKLHTARSRNDQVVFATKLYTKIQLDIVIVTYIDLFNKALDKLIGENQDIIMPGFTHLQHAQPVYLKDYLGAYKSMLDRDKQRLLYISDHLKLSLGAGALAGTPLEAEKYNEAVKEFLEILNKLLADGTNKDLVAAFKGVNMVAETNSLDTVSDRDFIIEAISALSIIATHLSRLAEDLILWTTQEFNFVELDEAYCTGSSLMPHKKNPDVLELVRGYAGRLYGNLVSVLTMMKGLPLTYNRDMQLDKEPLFNSFEIVSMELKVLKGLIETLKFNKTRIKKLVEEDEYLYATDLVYYLIKKTSVPFKEAHDIIGNHVKEAMETNGSLKRIFKNYIKQSIPDKYLEKEIDELFDPKYSVESKKSINRNLLGRIDELPTK